MSVRDSRGIRNSEGFGGGFEGGFRGLRVRLFKEHVVLGIQDFGDSKGGFRNSGGGFGIPEWDSGFQRDSRRGFG